MAVNAGTSATTGRTNFSHFVSLPLASNIQLVHKLNDFKTQILANGAACVGSRIDDSIFSNPKLSHLTVLMLDLSNERFDLATEVLKNISPKVMDALDNRPIFIRLKGLDCMQGSVDQAKVVYLPVEEIGSENRLSRACQVIIDGFVEAGLVLDRDIQRKLKLHATVMNVNHRKRIGWRRYPSDSFDAHGVFEKFGSEEWGVYQIREAHLSQRFNYDDNGYYHCCAKIPFP